MASNVVVTVLAESEVEGEDRLVLLVLAELAGVLGGVDAGLRGLSRLCRMAPEKVEAAIERLEAAGHVRTLGKGRWKVGPGVGARGARAVTEAAQEGRRGRAAFVKPTVAEVRAYAQEKEWVLDVEEFWLHHEKNGWKTRTGPISSWKAAVALWAKREERGDFKR